MNEDEPATPNAVETIADVARRYDVSRAAVTKWKKEGAPFVKQGRLWVTTTDEIDQWCRENGRGTGAKRRRFGKVMVGSKYEGTDQQLSRDIQEAELRRRQADADKKEMLNRKLAGELIPRADVESLERGRIVAMRAGLLALSNKLAARLAHLGEMTEIEGIVDSEVRALLTAYAEGREYVPDLEEAK